MSMFTLVITCLTTSNLPWFMDITFQVLMQYFSLQHQTLFSSPVTSTTGHCFHFGAISSFFLELFLHPSPVVYWAFKDLGGVHLSVSHLFAFSYMFIGFSRQKYWSGFPFPSAVDHVLLEGSRETLLEIGMMRVKYFKGNVTPFPEFLSRKKWLFLPKSLSALSQNS